MLTFLIFLTGILKMRMPGGAPGYGNGQICNTKLKIDLKI